MAKSTTTILQAVNAVLLQIGERTVSSLGSITAQKGLLAVQESIRDLSAAHDWSWTKVERPATSWNNNAATLDNCQRIYKVKQRASSADGYRTLKYLSRADFDQFHTALSGEASWYWTQDDDETVLVYPTPASSTAQDNFKFYFNERLEMPSLATDTLPVPERLISLVYKRSLYHLAISHLDDKPLAQIYLRQYEDYLRDVRNRERGRGVGTMSMYRKRI